MAVTYNAEAGPENFRLYVDGELAVSETVTGDMDGKDGIVFAGYYGAWVLDDLRFWDRALSQEELLANMGASLQGDEEGLVGCYIFDGTTRDMTGRGNDGVLMYKEEFLPLLPHSPG